MLGPLQVYVVKRLHLARCSVNTLGFVCAARSESEAKILWPGSHLEDDRITDPISQLKAESLGVAYDEVARGKVQLRSTRMTRFY